MRLVLWAALLGVLVAQCAPAAARLRTEFRDPPRRYAQAPFWFWNGAIREDGLTEQIRSMETAGVYGFVIHARMGLAKEVGYMTPRWLELVRFAVEEAARRSMFVYLYDEGMYPSGSARGKVVEGRPDLASQGLAMEMTPHTGPARLRLEAGLVSAVMLARHQDGRYRPGGQVLAPGAAVEIPDGEWALFRFRQVPSGGVIRGVHFDEEDSQPNAPPSADLLNPEATARFLAETHERYYRALAPHFGSTIRGIFTDEPNILGRRARRGLKPWTRGLLPAISRFLGYDFEPYLPFLWVAAPNGLETTVRADFERAVAAALNESYYRPISEWCARHGIALTGHPSGGAEMAPQIHFQEPGQDIVWRWVLPGPTSLEGEESMTGKTAASMAAHLDREIVMNECYGAYGWRLTMSEMKWLADWLFVRGTNFLMPHAFYYSVEGPRLRERPPDLAWSNLWWRHYRKFADYTRRMSWLMRGGAPIADVAILALGGEARWRAAKILYESQLDFLYLDESLLERARFRKGRLELGVASHRLVLLDGAGDLTPATQKRLRRLIDAGIPVLAFDSPLNPHPILGGGAHGLAIRNVLDATALRTAIEELVGRDVRTETPQPDLRYAHRVKDGIPFYLLANEGNDTIRTNVSFHRSGRPELWDAETGEFRPAPTTIELHPRNSMIFAFTGLTDETDSAPLPEATEEVTLPASGWNLTTQNRDFGETALGSWTRLDGMDSFSGAGWYQRVETISPRWLDGGGRVLLDAGNVREFAEVEINGRPVGVRLWPPFRFDITEALVPGRNTIRLGVTNTRANELTQEKLPSGLLGPVRLLLVPGLR
jgi:hypothetical protein